MELYNIMWGNARKNLINMVKGNKNALEIHNKWIYTMPTVNRYYIVYITNYIEAFLNQMIRKYLGEEMGKYD